MTQIDRPSSLAGGNPVSTSPTGRLVNTALVKWHVIGAVFWLAIALFAGLFYALQLIQHWPLPKIAVLSPGRIRMIHTNLIALTNPASKSPNRFSARRFWR